MIKKIIKYTNVHLDANIVSIKSSAENVQMVTIYHMKQNYVKNVNKIVKHVHKTILLLVYHVILIIFLKTKLVKNVAVNAYNVLL